MPRTGPSVPPDFLVVGHLVQDMIPTGRAYRQTGWRLGGSAAYASLLAARLGLRTAVLTAAGPDLDLEQLLPNIATYTVPGTITTRMLNRYRGGVRRSQHLLQRGSQIRSQDVPEELRSARIVLLGPVAGEVDAEVAGCFRGSLIGVEMQGWLREASFDRRIRPVHWHQAPLPPGAEALFVSDEDLLGGEQEVALHRWSARVPVVVCTRGEKGAEVAWRDEWRHVQAFPSRMVDATGAGDVFAAAFLIRYAEGADPWEAARFAAAAASLVVEGEGVSNVPTRAMVEERMR
ncbi:MAG TPA: PfkB family carbohydrate kinase [Dehalococcoidia bacterium]|nr:PfkB family carbohydrate kinase [Dehalococcoidia bacterium]